MFGKKSAPKPAKSKPATSLSPKFAEATKPAKKGLFGLGKKKGGGPPANSPEKASAPAAQAGEAKPSGAPPKKAKGGSPLRLLLPVVLVLAIAGVGYFAYTRFFAAAPAEHEAAAIEAPAPSDGAPPPAVQVDNADAPTAGAPSENVGAPPPAATDPIASDSEQAGASPGKKGTAKALKAQSAPRAAAADCGTEPAFIDNLKLGDGGRFSTNEPGMRGVILLSPVPNTDAVSKYQHQSWSSAGFFDAFVKDAQGNLYLAPSPRTGLGVSEPTNQDHIYKLAADSGELSDYVTLPSAAPPSPENPYGVVGLAYDCDTNSLYATTVTGSTAENQVGGIYRIDLNTGEVASKIDNIDGYGVAVRAAESGKQLVFGSPRDSQIRAVGLDDAGNFQGDPQTVAALADTQRARQITFANANEMIIQAAEFSFANAEIPQTTEVRFQYDAAANTWTAG